VAERTPHAKLQAAFASSHSVCSKSSRNTDGAHCAESMHRLFRDTSAWYGGGVRELKAIETNFSLDAAANGGNV
jgi:hypothetical protein